MYHAPSAIIAGLLITAHGDSSIVYVDAGAPAGGNGTTWATAYRFLQDAIDEAATPGSGIGEIRVSHGTYYPDQSESSPGGTGDRNAVFQLLPGVAIRGGFAGAASATPDARDVDAHPTILSGDLAGDDEPNWVHHDNNSFHLLRAVGVDDSAVADGLIIRGGYASWQSSGVGAGIEILSASPTLKSCTFDQCLSSMGGALFCSNGSPVITGCTFTGNYAWGGRGGAMYLATPSTVVVSEGLYSGNKAFGAGGPGDGGAVFIENACPTTFDHCTFAYNQSSTSGSTYPTGGAITALSDNLILNGCRFLKNSATLGAGGGIWSASDHAIFSSCEFSGNAATVGAAAAIFLSLEVSFSNCTIVGNAAGDGGGLSITYSSTATIRNCIFWSNTANAASPYKAAIHKDETSSATVSWTCIQQMWVPEPGEDPLDPENFPGCTDANPTFVDGNGADDQYGTIDDDFRLAAGSPLIDAADNAAVPAITTTDVAGLPRRQDDPATPDTGSGAAPIVDMGAHEFGEPPLLGDLNHDGFVNGADITALLGSWGPCASCPADLNDDGMVEGGDITVLLGAWTG